jgi:predicted permease
VSGSDVAETVSFIVVPFVAIAFVFILIIVIITFLFWYRRRILSRLAK